MPGNRPRAKNWCEKVVQHGRGQGRSWRWQHRDDVSGFVTKIISKINSLLVTVVAGGKEGMPNINSTINSLFVDARADIEIDNCDKAERQAWYRKGCARNINGIEKLVDVGENICEGLNGIGFGVNGSRVINSVLERGRSGASDREGGGGDFEGVSGSTRNAFVCCALRGGATEKAGEVVVTSEEIKLSERDCYNFLDGGGAVCSREYVFVEGFAQRSIVQGTTGGGSSLMGARAGSRAKKVASTKKWMDTVAFDRGEKGSVFGRKGAGGPLTVSTRARKRRATPRLTASSKRQAAS